jgi:hypothetical protein
VHELLDNKLYSEYLDFKLLVYKLPQRQGAEMTPFNLGDLAHEREQALSRELLRSPLVREAREQRAPRQRRLWRPHRQMASRAVDQTTFVLPAEIVAYPEDVQAAEHRAAVCGCETAGDSVRYA